MYKIYKYTSPSGKSYIGQTVKTQRGRSGLNGSQYENCPLFWKAIQKYGWESFEYSVLDLAETQEEADEKEIYYISLYNTANPEFGYNIRSGGTNSDNYEYNLKLKKIQQMWDEGYTIGEIASTLQIEKATLSYDCLRLGIDGKERIKRSAGQYHAKKVYQYNLNFDLINIYDSTADAERATNITNIRRSCKNNEELEKPKYKSGPYYWTYWLYPGDSSN